MDGAPLKRRRTGLTFLVPTLCLAPLVAVAWTRYHRYEEVQAAKNFRIDYEKKPAGFVSAPHGPSTLFKFRDPSNELVLRGAVNQIVSETNPTPELDTDGIANFYIDRTQQSMPTWTATMIGKKPGQGMEFEVVRRATKDRVVVTAYTVRGNTTLLVTLFGKGKAMDLVDPSLPRLYDFLKTFTLKEEDMSNL